ncbi:MAG: CHAP domain-containing protein [Polyangiaceae bacterium]
MRTLLTFVAAVSVVACGAASDTGEDVGSSDEALTGNDVATLASANVGTSACGTNSLGGKAFDSSCTGNGGYPEYWCADFARWVWEKTGAGSTNELTAAAGSFYVYGQKHGTLHNTPHLGDAAVFNYAGSGVADHVAIVTQVNSNGTIETVSGDWNGESGTEAHFSSTSHTVLNAPAYAGTVGTTPGVMGMKISGFIGPVGLDVPYAASYVAQSFPLATTTLTMVEGQTIASYIELKNAGTKTWNSSTKIGTTMPRERDSALADSTWLAPNRLSAVSGTVAPGATYKFKFNLHAPDKVGTYDEHFGILQEGVAWFSDSGQGGPADDVLEVKVNVIAPEYRGDLAKQSFPLAPATLAVHQGDVVNGFFELTNSGTQPWTAGKTELAPTPHDVSSPFADPSWLTPSRVSTVAHDVAPGDVGHFDVTLDATQVGDFQITFGLVQEGVTWFSDPTLGGGGPTDGLLRVHLVVVPPGAPLDAGVTGEPGDPGDAGDAVADSNAGAGDAPAGTGGCSLTPSSRTSPWGASVLAFIALAFVRRRRFAKQSR